MVTYSLLADLVVIAHATYVSFVLGGLILTLLGTARGWSWVRNFWFRAAHLAAIAIVCAEAVVGIVCPLTTLEQFLREKGGQARYTGSFIGHWVHELIFFEAPPGVLTVCYLVFGSFVVATFLLAPPRWPWRRPAAR